MLIELVSFAVCFASVFCIFSRNVFCRGTLVKRTVLSRGLKAVAS